MSDDSSRDDARLAELERRHRDDDESLSAQQAALRRRERTLAVLRETAEALLSRCVPTGLLEMTSPAFAGRPVEVLASAAATRGPA